jgi:hypothetical protein
MPAGQYRMVVNRSGRPTSQSPFPTLYYPGTADKQKATVVTIADGEHLENLDIRIPELARRIRITGRMQFRDGAPVVGGDVKFVSSDGKYEETSTTKKDGSYSLTIVAGAPGKIEGKIMVDRNSAAKCPDFGAEIKRGGWVAFLAPPPVSMVTEADQSDVTLVYPFGSCRGWRNYGLREQ